MPHAHEGPQQVSTPDATDVGGGAYLDEAKRLARKRRFREASAVLQTARSEGECSTAEALDLQARIYAQEGRYLLAEKCWTRALEDDPGNSTYVGALERLRSAATQGSPGRLVLGAVVVLAVSWQLLVANPAILDRLDGTTQALAEAQGSVDGLYGATQAA
ncbi:MAG: hypothetical protein P1V81_06915, partial [Planctomycetota bacterium]|nr:hypothetical protein [Planctomycetota bacterium]